MKKMSALILLAIATSSCRETWTDEGKRSFYEACTDEAVHRGNSKEKATAYCDCVFGKMKQKYPHEEDALEHIDELAKDTDLIKCKEEVK